MSAGTEDETALVEKAINDLMEHFDSVQIFVSSHHPERKDSAALAMSRGRGNWFTRYAQCREWMIYEEERIRVSSRKSEGEEEEEE